MREDYFFYRATSLTGRDFFHSPIFADLHPEGYILALGSVLRNHIFLRKTWSQTEPPIANNHNLPITVSSKKKHIYPLAAETMTKAYFCFGTFPSFFSAYLLGMIVWQNKGVSHATKDSTTYNPAPRHVHFMS